MNRKTATALVLTVVLSAVVVGASACRSASRPTDTPGVDSVGEFVQRYRGENVMVVLGFRYAAQNLGADWLLLEMAATSPSGRTARIERGSVFVRTPDGTQIPLATQAEFATVHGRMRPELRRADIMRDPLDYFSASRRPCSLGLFAEPGTAVTFDQVTVSDLRACEGRIFFNVPGGVQAGRWVLGIDLEEESIRIPFSLN